jgi:biotin transport system substrate-specific component
MNTTLALTLTQRWAKQNTLLTDALLVIAGSIVVALFAQVSIPLSFTPVPLTGQTFAVLLVGAALGSKRGASSLALYTLEGVIGLPVFAGWTSGLAKLIGPTGGYLIGFIVAAYVIGLLAERGLDRNWRTALVPFLIGTLVIYLFGATWLAYFLGLADALALGVLPFLIGDAIKLILAAIALSSAWTLVKAFDRS